MFFPQTKPNLCFLIVNVTLQLTLRIDRGQEKQEKQQRKQASTLRNFLAFSSSPGFSLEIQIISLTLPFAAVGIGLQKVIYLLFFGHCRILLSSFFIKSIYFQMHVSLLNERSKNEFDHFIISFLILLVCTVCERYQSEHIFEALLNLVGR